MCCMLRCFFFILVAVAEAFFVDFFVFVSFLSAALHLSLAIWAIDGIKIGFCNKIAVCIESLKRVDSCEQAAIELGRVSAQVSVSVCFVKAENVSLFSIETVFPSCARVCVWSCVLYVSLCMIVSFRFSAAYECLID